jgi:acid phosphatase type 7
MHRVGIIVLCALAACGSNETGNIAAPALGDTTHPAERGSPISALVDACGDGIATAAGAVIHRNSYLQQVTSSSAIFGWVTDSPAGEYVSITTPDGAEVGVARAEAESKAVRASGQNQMWATATGLAPNTTYCYRVANSEALMARTGFRTAPAADDPAPVRFLAFGDSGGGGTDQHLLEQQMLEFPSQLIIHTGDLAYDSGTLGQYEATVFDVYAELFRNLPFFPAAGNHDYKTSSGAPFQSVFALPNNEKWYSFDYGRVHFAALDTEASYGEQAAWLDADLAATTRPWKIVYMHRPPYSSGNHGSDTALRAKLAPIFQKHHVQLVLAGHDHDYERMIPQKGVAYVVTGGGGVGTRNVGKSSFTAFASEVIHFVYVEVGLDELILHAVDATGVEFDSMVVPR